MKKNSTEKILKQLTINVIAPQNQSREKTRPD